MTATKRLCAQAGLTVEQVCKEARLSRALLNRYIRYGAPLVAQQRLCEVFGDTVNQIIFIIGDVRYQEMLAQAAAGASGDAPPSGAADRARRQRPDGILTIV